jgi:hypothetical protein
MPCNPILHIQTRQPQPTIPHKSPKPTLDQAISLNAAPNPQPSGAAPTHPKPRKPSPSIAILPLTRHVAPRPPSPHASFHPELRLLPSATDAHGKERHSPRVRFRRTPSAFLSYSPQSFVGPAVELTGQGAFMTSSLSNVVFARLLLGFTFVPVVLSFTAK